MDEIEVRNKLINDGVAGGRIYRGTAPGDVIYPYIKFSVDKDPLTQDLQDNSSYRNTFDFQVYGMKFLQVKQAQIELVNSMRSIGQEIYYNEDEYPDPDTNSIRILNGWFVNEFN